MGLKLIWHMYNYCLCYISTPIKQWTFCQEISFSKIIQPVCGITIVYQSWPSILSKHLLLLMVKHSCEHKTAFHSVLSTIVGVLLAFFPIFWLNFLFLLTIVLCHLCWPLKYSLFSSLPACFSSDGLEGRTEMANWD